MEIVNRAIYQKIQEHLQPNKAVLVFGARRVGKTILLQQIVNSFTGKVMLLNGEDFDAQVLLAEQSIANYRRLLENVDLLVIDEAQNITNIGAKLKLIVDEVPNIRVVASGSSSFDLQNNVGEPLVGRSSQFLLTPFAQNELQPHETLLQTRQNLELRLLYGAYPDVVKMDNDMQRANYLREITNAYLLKDILSIDGLKNAKKMQDLLRLIAFQMGEEVSYDELGKQLGISKNTAEKYLDLLSKVFVIYRLGGFARNLRKEISKASKWYFYDNGIRNAIINNFSPLSLRQDNGALWENYIIGERIKLNYNFQQGKDFYFWRTYDQQEIDLIEMESQNISAFEIKKGEKSPSCPKAFADNYKSANYTVINKNNYLDFIL
ncbi:MAG: ATP-binding protein [Paludibacteraceae bacterium]|nr:ATP-binding protein [Paludibacteraceae bacterium]